MSARDDARLPEAAEAMLRDWPAPHREEAEWEQAAGQVADRIGQDSFEPASDDLLASPLPAEPDEGFLDADGPASGEKPADAADAPLAEAKPTKPRRPPPADDGTRPKLADLARARMDSSSDREEAARIAKESLLLIAEERYTGAAASTVAAAATRGAKKLEVEPAPTEDTRRCETQAAEVADLARARAQRAESARQAAPPADTRTGPMAAVALVVVGLAAGIALYVRGRAEPAAAPAPVIVVSAESAPAKADRRRHAKGTAPEAPAEDEKVGAPGFPAQDEEQVVALNDLESEHAAKLGRARGASTAPAQKGELVPSEKKEGKPSAAQPTEEDEDLQPALGMDRSIPEQPSSGALSSALAQVLGSARRCVVGHDRPSTATVVFSSDGTVTSVSVSGPAAGTGADACIRSSLSRMRLQRFSKPTYTVRGITIRP